MDTIIWVKRYCDELASCTDNDQRADVVSRIYNDGFSDGRMDTRDNPLEFDEQNA